MTLPEFLEQTLFARKLDREVRTIEQHAIVEFEVPSALQLQFLWRSHSEDETSSSTMHCALLPPEFSFYFQLVFLILLQIVFNAALGVFVYKILVQPQQQQQSATPTVATTKRPPQHASNTNTSTTALVFVYGIALPCVVMGPIYLIRALEIRNIGLVIASLSTPIVNALRITEALYGFAPQPAKQSLQNYVAYFSCLYGMEFDSTQPKPVTKEFLKQRLTTLARDFLLVSILLSVLIPHRYEYFDTNSKAAVDSMDHTIWEMISWQHIANNFLVALLLSTGLSQSTLGVSLIYNILYRVQTYEVVLNPIFRSKSPSDFWGRRWNTLVHTGLKNGVYKPTRQQFNSKVLGVVATFLVSGILHEYVNHVMFFEAASDSNSDATSIYRCTWKQIMFFGWNAVLILLEYTIGHWTIFAWTAKLPRMLRSLLVLCCALPMAHLFTGDWIRRGYFDAIAMAEPIIVCQ